MPLALTDVYDHRSSAYKTVAPGGKLRIAVEESCCQLVVVPAGYPPPACSVESVEMSAPMLSSCGIRLSAIVLPVCVIDAPLAIVAKRSMTADEPGLVLTTTRQSATTSSVAKRQSAPIAV